jgi:hypothetical protein
MAIKIRLPEHGVFWFLGDNLDEEAAIALLEHCDADGNLFPDQSKLGQLISAMLEDSYAHYFPDKGVMRHHQKIANRADIEMLDIDGNSLEL